MNAPTGRGALPRVQALTPQALSALALPRAPDGGDKEERGRVLIIAGCASMPGVAALCATASFRAGAGKVTIASCESVASMVAMAVPESRVIGLRGMRSGDIDASTLDDLGHFDSVLIGCGMEGEPVILAFVRKVLPLLRYDNLILDAYAMGAVRELSGRPPSSVLMTPHPGEMAHLLEIPKAAVEADLQGMAWMASGRFNAIVALKSAVTHIAACPDRLWSYDGIRHVGLGVSGSGDVLAGVIAGLAARGMPLADAAAWGVVLHGHAASALEIRFGPVGYLPRELSAEVPALMHRFQSAGASRLRGDRHASRSA